MRTKKLTEKEKQAIEDASLVTDPEAKQKRMIELEVHNQTNPIVTRMEKVLDRFETALPYLENGSKRYDNHFIWLVGLTVGLVALTAFSFGIYKAVMGIVDTMNLMTLSC